MSKLTAIRCAIYTRQSADPRDDLSSCQVQYEACRNFVDSRRGEGLRLIKECFDDEGYSGASLKRPALQRLLEFVRAGKVDRVVVHRLDRLSRNLRDYLVLIKEFRSSFVKLIVVTAPELGRAAHDTPVLNVLASFAEFERELAASRIAEARSTTQSAGKENRWRGTIWLRCSHA